MNFVKKAALVTLTPIFLTLLFATALDFGVLSIAGHPNNVKKIISDSGIYNNVVSSALAQAKQQNGGDINLNDPAIKNAADKALSPQVLQNSTNQIIDGVYNWLDGKSPQPNFNVDLSGAKATFADAVAQAASARASSLPACTSAPANFDVFNADCLPAGVSPAQAADQAKNSILSGQGFLDNPVISSSSFKDSNNQNVFDTKLKDAPKKYQNAKKTPYILAVLTILVGIALVFLSASWQRGLRHVGVLLVVVAILMSAFAYGVHKAVDTNLGKIKMDNALVQTDVRSLVQDLTNALEHNYYLFGIVYGVLGVAAFTAPMAYAKWGDGTSTATHEAPSEEAETPKPKVKKDSKKIDL